MDKVLKQRLIGATILIALAVIFVPMLFDDGPDRDQFRDTAIELPPPPAERREVRRLPLDPDQAREAPATPAHATAPEPLLPAREDREIAAVESAAEQEDSVLDEPIRLLEERVEPTAPAPAAPSSETVATRDPPAAERAGPAAPAATAGAWMVQVASFSSADTADRVMEQLVRLGHSAGIDVIVRGDSRLSRVRTGPYATRAEAERAQTQIAATVSGVEPVVMSAPEGLSPAHALATGGFSVQVGSFTARANADRLTEQLLGNGYAAFIFPDETGTRAIWRVRVGTLATRDEAASLRRELLEDAGLEGLIVSHP